MSQMKIGELNASSPGARDAVHVPVICVSSYAELSPGQRVRIDQSGRECLPEFKGAWDGVVDPFLTVPTIPPRTPLYVFVKPALVASFRHAFDIEGVLSESEYDDNDWNCNGCY